MEIAVEYYHMPCILPSHLMTSSNLPSFVIYIVPIETYRYISSIDQLIKEYWLINRALWVVRSAAEASSLLVVVLAANCLEHDRHSRQHTRQVSKQKTTSTTIYFRSTNNFRRRFFCTYLHCGPIEETWTGFDTVEDDSESRLAVSVDDRERERESGV